MKQLSAIYFVRMDQYDCRSRGSPPRMHQSYIAQTVKARSRKLPMYGQEHERGLHRSPRSS